MKLNITEQVEKLEQLTVNELRIKYQEQFGEETRSRNKPYLVKRVLWRMQANAHSGLSERARHRAVKIANEADLRLIAPKNAIKTDGAYKGEYGAHKLSLKLRDPRLPMPGTVLTREYKGETLHVTVLRKGFEFQGEVYRSLSAVARKVSGSQWNGYLFFNLQKRTKKK